MNEETKKALDIIKEVCAVFNGNLAQHESIQKAVKTLESTLADEAEGEQRVKL